ncbi:unnamed protein product, partial [Cyprideis torosa]
GIPPCEENCRLQCVKILLDAGASIQHCDKNGNIALHYATRDNHPCIAQYLLTVDPSLCLVKNAQGKTALTIQQAVEWKNSVIISILIQHGAPVDEEDQEKRTPLLLAIGWDSSLADEKNQLQCVKVLVEAGANVLHRDRSGHNALRYATRKHYMSIAQYLLTVDPSLCRVKNSQGKTALHNAADKAQPALISFLLQNGADVEAEDKWKQTPLLSAIGWRTSPSEEGDRLQCVKVLVEAGANTRHRNMKGRNALRCATGKKYLLIVQYLLTVDPSLCLVKNSRGETALKLFRAAEWGLVDSLSLLLQHGAQVDEEDEEKLTPLLLAIGRNSSPSEEECRL